MRCRGCGRPVTAQSRTGYCRLCARRHKSDIKAEKQEAHEESEMQEHLGNPLVRAFARMDPNERYLHLEHRHGARGYRTPAEWDAWHSAAHTAELAHEHGSAAENERAEAATQPITQPPPVQPTSGALSVRDARAAAWAVDIRNPAFEERTAHTVVDAQDTYSTWEGLSDTYHDYR